MLEEQHELNDQRGEAVDAGYEVPKTDQKLRLCSRVEEQADCVEPPGDLEGHLPALAVANHPVNDESDPRERLRTDLPSLIVYLIEDPPGLSAAE